MALEGFREVFWKTPLSILDTKQQGGDSRACQAIWRLLFGAQGEMQCVACSVVATSCQNKDN